jgi:hypothetical protein
VNPILKKNYYSDPKYFDPQPPFDAGSPDKAPAPIVAALREQFGKLLQG